MHIKKRKAKLSERGIYIQDIELLKTQFKPGSTYSYIVDPKKKEVRIVPSEDGNKVSKRKHKESVKSVIDIRNREALQAFEGSDYLEVTIFEDYIKVTGIKKSSGVVYSLSDYMVTSEVLLSRRDLKAASGEQLSLFSSISFEEEFEDAYQFDEIDEVITAVSLFSGAGVMDLGFKEDFKIIFGVEKDKHAVETYRHNHGDHIVEKDIRDLIKSDIPRAKLMFGGPPCQGFSNSNRVTNFLSNPNNLLVREFIESVKANPDCEVFVLENVPGILTAGDGQFLSEIKEALSDFEVTAKVLNSSNFGTPQSRRRAIIVGSKIGKINLPDSDNSMRLNVGQAFLNLSDCTPNQLDYSKPREQTIERFRHVPPGGNIHDIPEAIRPRGSHSISYRRLMLNEVAPAIVNPRKSNILHPLEDRILSVRECARLFDVPDSFTFKGTLASMQQQIANAVPVKLAKAVAKTIKEAFQRNLSFA